jgi:hypothetical protein
VVARRLARRRELADGERRLAGRDRPVDALGAHVDELVVGLVDARRERDAFPHRRVLCPSAVTPAESVNGSGVPQVRARDAFDPLEHPARHDGAAGGLLEEQTRHREPDAVDGVPAERQEAAVAGQQAPGDSASRPIFAVPPKTDRSIPAIPIPLRRATIAWPSRA